MNDETLNYFYECFNFLVKDYGFVKARLINGGNDFLVDFSSANFTVRIEQYWQEFYISVYKDDEHDGRADLYNLLDYVNPSSKENPTFKSFDGEKNLDERFKMQFRYMAEVLSHNFDTVNDFFVTGNYKAKMADMTKFMINKYPHLFKTTRKR